MTTFDEIISKVDGQEPFRVPVRLLLDAAAYNRANELAAQLDRALKSSGDDDVTAEGPVAIAEQMAQLNRDYEPALFEFAPVDAATWSQLEAEHAGDRGRNDPFWLHAMAASCVTPEGATHGSFEQLRKSLSAGQFEQLRAACEQACWGLFDLRPTRAATALLRGSRPNSTSATDS